MLNAESGEGTGGPAFLHSAFLIQHSVSPPPPCENRRPTVSLTAMPTEPSSNGPPPAGPPGMPPLAPPLTAAAPPVAVLPPPAPPADPLPLPLAYGGYAGPAGYMSRFRWVILGLVFLAITINYIDRM